MKRRVPTVMLLPIFLGLAIITPGKAFADWTKVKRFIQEEVVIVREDDDNLVLFHPAADDSLVMSLSEQPGTDIYGAMASRRGSNPYRIWVASEQFWNDPDFQRSEWSKFFRATFLAIIRSPKKGK